MYFTMQPRLKPLSNRLKLNPSTFLSRNNVTTNLKEALAGKIELQRENVRNLLKLHAKTVVSNIDINSIYGGMRGLKALIYETSLLDPDEGIRFRGYSIPECKEFLPKAKGGSEPLPEGILWLLMTGDFPLEEQVTAVSAELAQRAALPSHVASMIKRFPPTLPPMSQFSAAITALSCESHFSKALTKGVTKSTYWEYVYEDAIDLIAKLPVIAAKIYSVNFKGGSGIGTLDTKTDWSANLVQMIGFEDPELKELMRLYMTLHSDHGGGNVSAHTVHLVGSALSDPYLAFAAGMNGLAGPLHGLATQEVLVFLHKVKKDLGDPTDQQLRDYIRKTLEEGHDIPGFGHTVLRVTDPRYLCQREFAMKYLPDDPMVRLTSQMFKVVPGVLQEVGKVSNPWPNVDANSGVLLQHYGLKDMQFYTVLFGVSRAIGTMSSLVWSRALCMPIERPKSFTTDEYMKQVQAVIK